MLLRWTHMLAIKNGLFLDIWNNDKLINIIDIQEN